MRGAFSLDLIRCVTFIAILKIAGARAAMDSRMRIG